MMVCRRIRAASSNTSKVMILTEKEFTYSPGSNYRVKMDIPIFIHHLKR